MSSDVTIVGAGVYDQIRSQVDPTYKALRVSLRPKETGVYGSYTFGQNSGVMAASMAAASPIFEFRWSSTAVIALVTRLQISAVDDGTAFAATSTSCFFFLTRATQFTATDATGSNNIVIKGKDCARSTRYAPSQIQQTTTTNIVISNTGALSAGTKTLDSSAMATAVGTGLGSATNILAPTKLVDPAESSRGPVELWTNEGLVVTATVAATGTWRFAIEMDWDEVDPARYLGIAG